MSRIGKAPIEIPENVEIKIQSSENVYSVDVKGPMGELHIDLPENMSVKQDTLNEQSVLLVERPNNEQKSRALHGLFRTLINNMVVGVTDGYKKELEIIGVGYRAEAKSDSKLVLQLGFSHPVEVLALEGVKFETPEPTVVFVSGIDKQAVGQTAATVRALKKPEPYKGKGIRYKGEHVIRKSVK